MTIYSGRNEENEQAEKKRFKQKIHRRFILHTTLKIVIYTNFLIVLCTNSRNIVTFASKLYIYDREN